MIMPSLLKSFMPIRVDYAIWGLCTAMTISQSLGVVPTSNPKTRAQYVFMKMGTWTMDYVYMFGTLYLLEMYLSGDNFTPKNVFLHQVINSICVCLVDLGKACIFWNLVPKAKTDHIVLLGKGLSKALFTVEGIKGNIEFLVKLLKGEGWLCEFSDGKSQRTSIRHQLWYFIKIGLIAIPGACYLQAFTGQMHWLPLEETVLVVSEGEWYEAHISRFLIVYTEYLVMSFIKDGISMNILHQMFHSIWYSHHKIHHLPMKELFVGNAFYFDILDLVGENVIGPIMMCSLKYLFGNEPSIHYASFVLSVICDQTVHSLNPYTISFWNPLLDNNIRPAVSHNLHHSTNRGHYTIWPLHQIRGLSGPKYNGKNTDGYDFDVMEYNKTFDTNFPCDL